MYTKLSFFQIFICHTILSNNCNDIFPTVLTLCSITRGVILEEEQQYIAQLTPGIIV